ncbi:T9SS type A sorting domain-containing protein [Kaistella sp.]|uniref:T9SS type A sorting domain-containing protein n=1 Tax=Kaistella sp. TaxID=2782235 RepID=UPI003C6FBF52
MKSISVSDVSGRQVKNMKPSAELNLSDLKTGLYIVTLHMEDGTVKSFKTVKK